MTEIPVPQFWQGWDRSLRRTLLNQISSNAARAREDWGGRRRATTIALDVDHLIRHADDRFCMEAKSWVQASIVAERESIAAEIEATYPDIGKVIADAIRARPEPLKQEEEAA